MTSELRWHPCRAKWVEVPRTGEPAPELDVPEMGGDAR